MLHVQSMKIERQFHNIERVPRVFGPDTKFVPSGGSVQFGWNVEAFTSPPNAVRTRRTVRICSFELLIIFSWISTESTRIGSTDQPR